MSSGLMPNLIFAAIFFIGLGLMLAERWNDRPAHLPPIPLWTIPLELIGLTVMSLFGWVISKLVLENFNGG